MKLYKNMSFVANKYPLIYTLCLFLLLGIIQHVYVGYREETKKNNQRIDAKDQEIINKKKEANSFVDYLSLIEKDNVHLVLNLLGLGLLWSIFRTIIVKSGLRKKTDQWWDNKVNKVFPSYLTEIRKILGIRTISTLPKAFLK